MADVQLTVIDQQDTQIALAVPGIQGATGPTGSVAAAANGTAALPSITFTNDPSTGISYVPTQALAFSVAGVQRAVMSASVFAFGPTTGDCAIEVGNGATANRAAYIDLIGDTTYTDYGLRFLRGNNGANADSAIIHRGTGPLVLQTQDAGPIRFDTTGTERLRIDAGGNVGIGTSAPQSTLEVIGTTRIGAGNIATAFPSSSAAGGSQFSWNRSSGSAETNICNLYDNASLSFEFSQKTGASTANVLYEMGSSSHNWRINNTERARIDSSGRLLVGTSIAYDVPTGDGAIRSPGLQRVATLYADSTISSTLFNTDPNGGGTLSLARSNTTTIGAQAIALNNDVIGAVYFSASDGIQQIRSAEIFASVDGTPGTNDMPGRLVFSTTADGASTPTERMRIKSTGTINLSNVATYADNTAATAGGLAVGDVYRTATGQLMIRY